MGRRSPSQTGLLDGPSLYLQQLLLSGSLWLEEQKKVYMSSDVLFFTEKEQKKSTRLQMSCFLPKISVKQCRSKNFLKGGHNFHIF